MLVEELEFLKFASVHTTRNKTNHFLQPNLDGHPSTAYCP